MKCPYCGYNESKVIDSRSTEDDLNIRRRRECLNCTKRYTTYEKIEDIPILVIKKNESREYFDKSKIVSGIIKACQKRAVSRSQIEEIGNNIEKKLSNDMVTEIRSEEIGEMIMESLKDIDQVSYVRFASVYREFKDVNTFLDEIKNLISNKDKQEGKNG